jgi:hypothetical protein
MVFAFLFGLSMDYEVFILARVREEHDRLPALVSLLGRWNRWLALPVAGLLRIPSARPNPEAAAL